MGSFNTYSNSTRSCALFDNVLSGFPIFERLISLNSDQGDVGSNPSQGNYSFPQKLSSVEFPVTFYIIYIFIFIFNK